MMWKTTKANVPSTTKPSYHEPPAEGRDGIVKQADYNDQPMDFKNHRNRHLINSKVCGMSCEKQQSCENLEKVLSFLKKLRLI